jgi:hypothetical protein
MALSGHLHLHFDISLENEVPRSVGQEMSGNRFGLIATGSNIRLPLKKLVEEDLHRTAVLK